MGRWPGPAGGGQRSRGGLGFCSWPEMARSRRVAMVLFDGVGHPSTATVQRSPPRCGARPRCRRRVGCPTRSTGWRCLRAPRRTGRRPKHRSRRAPRRRRAAARPSAAGARRCSPSRRGRADSPGRAAPGPGRAVRRAAGTARPRGCSRRRARGLGPAARRPACRPEPGCRPRPDVDRVPSSLGSPECIQQSRRSSGGRDPRPGSCGRTPRRALERSARAPLRQRSAAAASSAVARNPSPHRGRGVRRGYRGPLSAGGPAPPRAPRRLGRRA